jgi:tetratricopeptide (TPR) repeat protein
MNMKKLGAIVWMTLATIGAYAQTLTEGLRALDFEQFEKARGIFTTLIQNEPANGNNYYYLGQAQWNLFKPEEALKAYKAGITAASTNPMNYAGWGELLLEEGKVEEAKEQFNRALSFNKGKDGKCRDINALRVVADAMVSSETKLTADAVILIEQALELSRKDYDVLITAGDVYLEKDPSNAGPAASKYEDAISLQKSNPKAYTRVSSIWLRVKNAEATKSALDRALEIDSNYAPALKNLAEYYSLSKQYAKAKDTYERYLLNSEPSNANKARFARILFRNKEYRSALYVILEVQKSDSSDIFLYRLAGYSYYEVGIETKDTNMYRPGAESLERFMAQVDSKKILSNDYEYLGKLYSKIKGKEDLAVANINKAIETDPDKIELYKEAATIYNNIRQYDKACASFESYIAKTSKPNAADYFLMGKAALFSKQYGKADTAFAKVNELKPDYAEAYYYRGNALASLDPEYKTTGAKDNWEKYVSLTEATPDKYKKNLINTYDYLARYYIGNDNNAKAKEYYTKLLALDPENKDAKDKLKLLK